MIFRSLTVFERNDVRDFYLDLGADDRRKRFCNTLSDEYIAKYVDALDFTRHWILGAFDEDARLVGLAELASGEDDAEMAFAVRPEMRCRSIGTRLMQRLLRHAAMCGVKKVFVMFLRDNTPMRVLAMRAGMQVTACDGEAYARRELPAPTLAEVSVWLADESAANNGYFGRLGIMRWTQLASESTATSRQIGDALRALAA